MGTDLPDTAALLSDLDATQAKDMLQYVSRSPRLQTRVNALVAWGVLVGAAPNDDEARSAVERLVHAALAPLEDDALQGRLLQAAVDELGRLPGPLRLHAWRTTQAQLRLGSGQAVAAARLATLMARQGGFGSGMQAYRGLWLARFSTLGRTWIDGLPQVLALSLAAVALIGALLLAPTGHEAGPTLVQRLQSDISLGDGPRVPEWLWRVLLATLAGLVAAALAVPSRVLAGTPLRWLDTLLLPAAVLLGPALLLEWLSPADMPTLVCWFGALVVARGVSLQWPWQRGGPGRLGLIMVTTAGWGCLALLLAAAVEPWLVADTGSTGLWWPHGACIVCGMAAGIAWAETREAPPAADTDTATTAHAMRHGLGQLSGLVLFLVLIGVAQVQARREWASLEREQDQLVKDRSARYPLDLCAGMGKEHTVTLRDGQLYPANACEQRTVQVLTFMEVTPQAPARDDIEVGDAGTRLMSLSDRLEYVDMDTLPATIRHFGATYGARWLCFSTSGKTCPHRNDPPYPWWQWLPLALTAHGEAVEHSRALTGAGEPGLGQALELRVRNQTSAPSTVPGPLR